jgi:hypothetical protein
MIDKYDLQQAIKEYMPELKTIDKDTLFGLIENMNEPERRKIQVWLGNEDTVPTDLGVYEDITDFKVNLAHFNKNMQITFEEAI